METARCRAFVVAADTGSFSKAAEALSYTPSGVNQLVTALEKELGFPLFRRNTKGVSLTENGRLLLPAIRKFLRQEDRIFELSAEMNGLLIGSVNIAAYSSIATHWLPAVIEPSSPVTVWPSSPVCWPPRSCSIFVCAAARSLRALLSLKPSTTTVIRSTSESASSPIKST